MPEGGAKRIEYITGIEIDCTYAGVNFHVLGYGIQADSRDFADIEENAELIGEVLLAKPEYLEHPLLKPYRRDGARGDNPYVNFYWDYYAQGKPCYVEMKFPPMEEILDTIHRNGGKAVLAHPAVNLKGHEQLLDSILDLGIDGIEAYSSYHTAEQADFYCQKAKEKGMFATCGSDYHGKTKPSVHLAGYPSLPSDFQLQELSDMAKTIRK